MPSSSTTPGDAAGDELQSIFRDLKADRDRFDSFKQSLIGELGEGCHIVPLIGQGISNLAGVVTPFHHFRYLIYTFFRCVAPEDSLRKAGEEDATPWNLPKNGFPAYPNTTQLDFAVEWFQEVHKAAREENQRKRPKKSDQIRIRDLKLRQAIIKTLSNDGFEMLAKFSGKEFDANALRYPKSRDYTSWASLGDWIALLGLLSRIRIGKPSQSNESEFFHGDFGFVDKSDPTLIEAFHIFSARGVRPGLAHQMLAYLARPLSIHTILTTNTDTLIEDAFQRIRWPLRVFDVDKQERLTGEHQVRAQDSVVKINYRSTDLTQRKTGFNPEEKNTLFRYLFPAFPEAAPEAGKENFLTPPGRMLVMGLEPKYDRTISALEFLLEKVAEARKNETVKAAIDSVTFIRKQLRQLGNSGNIYDVDQRWVSGFLGKSRQLVERAECDGPRKQFGQRRRVAREKIDQAEEAFNYDLIGDKGSLNMFGKSQFETGTKEVVQSLYGVVEKLNGLRDYVSSENQKEIVQLLEDYFNSSNLTRADFLSVAEARALPAFLVTVFHEIMRLLLRQGLSWHWAVANFRIFWVCGSKHEEQVVRYRLEKEAIPFEGVIEFVSIQRPDILLYEIYQEVNYCLPPGGMTYQFVHLVPPDPPKELWLENGGSPHVKPSFLGFYRHLQELIKCPSAEAAIEWCKEDTEKEFAGHFKIDPIDLDGPGKILRCEGGRGLSSAASLAFRELRRQHYECIWLELCDYRTANDVYNHILTSIAFRMGVIQKEHVSFVLPESGLSPSDRAALISRLSIASRSWVIFLYGRNLPGGNAGWEEFTSWTTRDPESSGKGSDDYEKFEMILGELTKLSLTLVYFPFPESRAESLPLRLGLEGWKPDAEPRDFAGHKSGKPVAWEHLHDLASRSGNGGIFSRVIDWISEGNRSARSDSPQRSPDTKRDRLRFLYALSLFRHSRHFSALASEATYPCRNRFSSQLGSDNDIFRAQLVRKWVSELEDRGLLRRKHGGFAWMHWEFRAYLQRCIENEKVFDGGYFRDLSDFADHDEAKFWLGSKRRMVGLKARTHHWIAEWYFKAFLASRHPTPLLECLFHHYQTILWSPEAEPPEPNASDSGQPADPGISPDEWILSYRVQLARVALLELATAIKVAIPSIRFWMNNDVGQIITQEGASPEGLGGLHAQLEQLRQQMGEEGDPDQGNPLGRLLILADARPILELISGQCKTIHQILADEDGRTLFVGREPHDEVPPHVELRLSTESADATYDFPVGTEVLGMNPKVRDQICERLKDLGIFDQGEREQFLDPSLRLGVPRLVGKWFGRFSDDSEEDSKLGKLIETLIDLKDATGRNHYRLREQLRNQVWSIPKELTKKAPLHLRRREEVRAMTMLLSSTAHLCAREANLNEARGFLMRYEDAPVKGEELARVEADFNERWAHVCALCNSILRIGRHLYPIQSDLQLRETVAIRTLYGAALAHLRRFKEAHRFLDEAFATLINSRYALLEPWWGIVALRRSEVYLYEALNCDEKNFQGIPSTFRRRLSLLDDAWAAAVRAQEFLGGGNRSNWWWGRLDLLKIRILVEIESLNDEMCIKYSACQNHILPLAQRTRMEKGKQIFSTLEHAQLLQPVDGFRNRRVAEQGLRIQQAKGFSEKETHHWRRKLGDKCRAILASLPPPIQPDRNNNDSDPEPPDDSDSDPEPPNDPGPEPPNDPGPEPPNDPGPEPPNDPGPEPPNDPGPEPPNDPGPEPPNDPGPEPPNDPGPEPPGESGHSVSDLCPTAPYTGDAPFIFLSYKREEMGRIAPHLAFLSQAGYKIWYDKGIPGGSEWDSMIEQKVTDCQLLLVFLSQAAADSKWVRREIKYADRKERPILIVNSGDVKLKHGLDITLQQNQMINEGGANFFAELLGALDHCFQS